MYPVKDDQWREYGGAGSGVHFPFGEPSLEEQGRINKLVLLNNRYVRYTGRGSAMGLFKLAAEYRRLGMTYTARRIYLEAKKMRHVIALQKKEGASVGQSQVGG